MRDNEATPPPQLWIVQEPVPLSAAEQQSIAENKVHDFLHKCAFNSISDINDPDCRQAVALTAFTLADHFAKDQEGIVALHGQGALQRSNRLSEALVRESLERFYVLNDVMTIDIKLYERQRRIEKEDVRLAQDFEPKSFQIQHTKDLMQALLQTNNLNAANALLDLIVAYGMTLRPVVLAAKQLTEREARLYGI